MSFQVVAGLLLTEQIDIEDVISYVCMDREPIARHYPYAQAPGST